MDTERLHGLMANPMKASTFKMKNREKGEFHMGMDLIMKGSGIRDDNMEEVNSREKMVKYMRATFSLEN